MNSKLKVVILDECTKTNSMCDGYLKIAQSSPKKLKLKKHMAKSKNEKRAFFGNENI